MERRRQILESLGARGEEVDELLKYTGNHFTQPENLTFPLPDEPFIETWQRYLDGSKQSGVFETLKQNLVQLQFPIQQGMSHSESYRAVTLRGKPAEHFPEATGLLLKQPERLELKLHETPAGRIFLLIIRNRDDFVSLVQALSLKSEPEDIPPSFGACAIKGLNNWDRIQQYRKCWEKKFSTPPSEEEWGKEFQEQVIPNPPLYQDRLILLSDGPYSGISASEINLPEEEWREKSLLIRQEHECTHYFTLRVFSSMKNNIFDELLADYSGITTALGYFRPDWFLHFIGLEHFPIYRSGGRLEQYRGHPPLSDGAFYLLQLLVKRAAENLGSLTVPPAFRVPALSETYRMVMFLSRYTLEDVAAGSFSH